METCCFAFIRSREYIASMNVVRVKTENVYNAVQKFETCLL